MSYKEDILRLRAEGKSYSEISEALGCSKGTISYYLKEEAAPTMDIQSEPVKVTPNTVFQDKAINYVENIKETRACIDCGSRLHKSQMDPLDGTNVDKIIASVFDKETLEESKRHIHQLKFICANCGRLRKFKEDNKGK